MLKTKRLSLVPTLRCTLNCKLCSNHMPNFHNSTHAPLHTILQDIDAIFSLFDTIEWLQFVGGEIFMHPDLDKMFTYCQKYQSQFDRFIIETNATLLPTKPQMEALKSYGDSLKVMISDYGTLSYQKDAFVQWLTDENIDYVLKKYHDDEQHFGGWIDNTKMEHLGEDEDIVDRKAAACPQVRLENMHCYSGNLHRCSNSLFMYELGIYTPKQTDFVRLHEADTSKAEKQNQILGFYQKHVTSCEYCLWKDADSLPRFLAAEQISR